MTGFSSYVPKYYEMDVGLVVVFWRERVPTFNVEMAKSIKSGGAGAKLHDSLWSFILIEHLYLSGVCLGLI